MYADTVFLSLCCTHLTILNMVLNVYVYVCTGMYNMQVCVVCVPSVNHPFSAYIVRAYSGSTLVVCACRYTQTYTHDEHTQLLCAQQHKHIDIVFYVIKHTDRPTCVIKYGCCDAWQDHWSQLVHC